MTSSDQSMWSVDDGAAGYHPLATVTLESVLIGWRLTVQRGPDQWSRWYLRRSTAEAARQEASEETDRWVQAVKETIR